MHDGVANSVVAVAAYGVVKLHAVAGIVVELTAIDEIIVALEIEAVVLGVRAAAVVGFDVNELQIMLLLVLDVETIGIAGVHHLDVLQPNMVRGVAVVTVKPYPVDGDVARINDKTVQDNVTLPVKPHRVTPAAPAARPQGHRLARGGLHDRGCIPRVARGNLVEVDELGVGAPFNEQLIARLQALQAPTGAGDRKLGSRGGLRLAAAITITARFGDIVRGALHPGGQKREYNHHYYLLHTNLLNYRVESSDRYLSASTLTFGRLPISFSASGDGLQDASLIQP